MKVKVIKGTSQSTCKCGSWIAHWERFSGYERSYCSEESCINRDLVGAHVQKDGSSDMSRYIVPLCQIHNQSKESLNVGFTTLVSADKKITCEKLRISIDLRTFNV